MNIIEVQESLKDLPDNALMQEMQNPTGSAPQFLVLSELKRRKRMRDDYQRRQAGDIKTVAEEAVTAAGAPQEGIMQVSRAMAPNTNVAQNTGMGMAAPVQPTQAPQMMADGGVVKMQTGGFMQALMDKRGLVGGTRLGDKFPFNALGYGSGERFSDDPNAFKPAPPFPADDPNPRKRGEWMEQYGETHNLDGSPKFTDPNAAATDVGISSLSADTGDYMPPSIAMQTQSKLSAAASPDRYVPRMGDSDPLGRKFMDEYRANMSEASVPATEGLPVPQVFDATIPASSNELVDTSIEDLTRTTPSIRGNDGSAEQLELGIDPTLSRETTDLVYEMNEAAFRQPTLYTDAPAGPISMPIGNKGGIYSLGERGSVVGGDQSYGARFGFTPSIDEPVGATQEAIDSAKEAAKLREEQGITDASGSVGALLAAGDEAAAQEIIENARKAAETANAKEAANIQEKQDITKQVFGFSMADLFSGGDSEEATVTDTAATEDLITEEAKVESADKKSPTIRPRLRPADLLTPTGPSGPSGPSGLSGADLSIASLLEARKKEAEADKWMALAYAGMELMKPTATIGEGLGKAGQAGLGYLTKSKQGLRDFETDMLKLQTQMDIANIRAAASGRSSSSASLTTNRVILKELLAAVDNELMRIDPLGKGKIPSNKLDDYNRLIEERQDIIEEMRKLTTLGSSDNSGNSGLSGTFDVPSKP